MSGSSSTSSSGSGTVPNPMHTALSQLYTQLQKDAPTMSNALKAANTQMSGGDTWVGPTAQAWGTTLDGHARDCSTQVSNMLADVSTALAAEPAMVTPQEAQAKGREMAMIERQMYY